VGAKFPNSVFDYCGYIAARIARGEVWKPGWESLIKTLYSAAGDAALARRLGLPPSIPPYQYETGDLDLLVKEFEVKLTALGEDGTEAQEEISALISPASATAGKMTVIGKSLHDSAMSIIRDMSG
jgi:hypothetical protein